jgi:hypothetical protein
VCGEPGEVGDVDDLASRPPSGRQMLWTYVAEELQRLELGEVA